MPRRTVTVLAASVVGAATTLSLLVGCDDKGSPEAAPPFRLVAFDSCQNLLDGLRAAARSRVGPYGFDNPYTGAEPAEDVIGGPAGEAAAGATAQRAAPAPGGGEPAYSGTNNHEAAADEPDIVKTDGRRIVTLSRTGLRIVDVAARKVTGTVPLNRTSRIPVDASQLLLSGDHALILDRAGTVEGRRIRTRLTLIDLVGRSTGGPSVSSEYTIDGTIVDARLVGSHAHVVVRSVPDLIFEHREGTPLERTDANRAVIDKAGLDAWLPRYETSSAAGRSSGQVDCGRVSRPADYTGTSLVSLLTFDLGSSQLGTGNPLSVLADGRTVYADGESLFLADEQHARNSLPDGPEGGAGLAAPAPIPSATRIYKFDLGAGQPRYVAAGAVDGWLLNQYSLSQWHGDLRVATTLTDPTVGGRPNARTESFVTVLREHDGALQKVGAVGGLGRGERVYAVRFLGAQGYVVTFRQTDPLYRLDLSDPTKPRTTGELKINGYSAYLHPAGDGRLIGIGQDATDKGRVQGTQVSLFDSADPAGPKRLAQYQVPGGHSAAEYDPHAFLYWPQTGLLVVPVTTAGDEPVPVDDLSTTVVPETGGAAGAPAVSSTSAPVAPDGARAPVRVMPTNVALVFTVSGDKLQVRGQIRHPASMISRSLVIGNTLWTVSSAGLQVNDVTTLAKLAWLPY